MNRRMKVFIALAVACACGAVLERTLGWAGPAARGSSQPAASGEVSLSVVPSREDGLTRLEFSWTGQEQPAMLVVGIDSSERMAPFAYGVSTYDLRGEVLVRAIESESRAALVFNDELVADAVGTGPLLVSAWIVRQLDVNILISFGKGTPTDVRPLVVAPKNCRSQFHVLRRPGSTPTRAFRDVNPLVLEGTEEAGISQFPNCHTGTVRALQRLLLAQLE